MELKIGNVLDKLKEMPNESVEQTNLTEVLNDGN